MHQASKAQVHDWPTSDELAAPHGPDLPAKDDIVGWNRLVNQALAKEGLLGSNQPIRLVGRMRRYPVEKNPVEASKAKPLLPERYINPTLETNEVPDDE